MGIQPGFSWAFAIEQVGCLLCSRGVVSNHLALKLCIKTSGDSFIHANPPALTNSY